MIGRSGAVEFEMNKNRDSDEESVDTNSTTQLTSFLVVITTYEMIIKNRVHIAKYDGSSDRR